MTTVMDAGAVQVHQTEPPFSELPKGSLGSALSSVAPASVPTTAIEEPARTVRLVKSSFMGGDWASAPVAETSITKAKEPMCRLLIFRAEDRLAPSRRSNLSAK